MMTRRATERGHTYPGLSPYRGTTLMNYSDGQLQIWLQWMPYPRYSVKKSFSTFRLQFIIRKLEQDTPLENLRLDG